MWVDGQRRAPTALPPGKTPYALFRRLGGPQGRSGGVRKNLAPTGIRSPDRPARSESLYRLRYPGPRPLWLTYRNSMMCYNLIFHITETTWKSTQSWAILIHFILLYHITLTFKLLLFLGFFAEIKIGIVVYWHEAVMRRLPLETDAIGYPKPSKLYPICTTSHPRWP